MQQAQSTQFIPDAEDTNIIIAYAGDGYGTETPLYKLATSMSQCHDREIGFRRAQTLFVGRAKMAVVVAIYNMINGSRK